MINTQQFAFTQGTQAAPGQSHGSYQSWCDKFLAIVAKADGGLSESSHNTSGVPASKATDNVSRAFDTLTQNDRYARLFDFLLVKCQTDHGELLVKLLNGFSAGLRHLREPTKHRMTVLNHMIEMLERAPLSGQNYSTVADLCKAQLSECSTRDLESLQNGIQGGFVDGTYRSRKTFDVLVAALECIRAKDPQQDAWNASAQATALSALYRECTEASCKAVTDLIRYNQAALYPLRNSFREVNEPTVFKKFIGCVMHAEEGHEMNNPITWLKVAAALSVLEQAELVTVLDHFSLHWKSVTNEQLIHHVAGFEQLRELFETHPTMASAVIRHVKNKRYHVWESTFSLVFLHVLCSVDRHTNEARGILASSLGKIWKNDAVMRRNLWMRKVIASESVSGVRDKITVLEELMKSSAEWFALLGPALERVSMSIMLDSAKSTELRLEDGRLKDSGDVGFVGRHIFVEVAMHNPYGIEKQMSRLIDAVFASASNTSIAYLLVDILLEITHRGVAMLMNATEAFKSLIDNVWILPDGVGVVLIRSILPVINQRPELKVKLMDMLKVQLIRPSAVSTALPILLLLWKSVAQHPSVANNPQMKMSQSFATFSSQALTTAGVNRRPEQVMAIEVVSLIKRLLGQSAIAKCLICQGLVDICRKVPFFAVQALDLLLPQLTRLPALDAKEYIDASKDGVSVKVPVAHLVKAVSTLIRITIANAANDTTDHTLAQRAEEAMETLLNEVATKALEDLALDKLTDFGPTKQGQQNLAFGRTMVQLYDVLVEHLWRTCGEDITYEQSEVLKKLLDTRDELHQILMEKTRQKDGDKEGKRAASAAVGMMSDDLHVDMLELDSMLQTLISYQFTEDNQYMEPLLKSKLIPWTLGKIHEQTVRLDPNTVSGASSLPCYASLAKSLLHLLLGDDHVMESLRSIKQHQPIKGVTLACYARILKYIVARYGQGSESTLKELLACFADIDFGQVQVQATQMTTQGHPGAPSEWRTVLGRHFYAYGSAMLTSLLCPTSVAEFREEKSGAELHRQVLTIVDLCSFIAKITPNTTGATQKYFYQILSKRAERCLIDDKRIVQEIFKTMFGLLVNSNCSEWTTSMVRKIMEQITLTSNDPEDNGTGWKSVNVKNREAIFVLLLQCLEQFFKNVRQALAIKLEMEHDIDDDFLVKICETVHRFAGVAVEAVEFGVQKDCQVDQMAVTLTHFYDSLTELFTQVVRVLKSPRMEAAKEWRCIDALEEIIRDCVVPIRNKCSDSTMGSWENQADEPRAQRKARQVKQQERIFVAHEKSVERTVVAVLMVGQLVDRDAFDLNNQKNFRCFRIETEVAVQRLERRSSEAAEENSEDEEQVDVNDEEQEGNEPPRQKRQRVQ
ncbi:CBN-FNCI-1 protein [Aphelenchoides avenae]|nr:CBN-FNCI-1 protein [Aphelenchus avenae]